jgi:hypothetical protein
MLQKVHVWVLSVLELHKAETQARTLPPSAPHFVRGDKVTIVTKNLFLRGQPNRKLRDGHLYLFCRRAYWEIYLHVVVTSDNSLTPGVSYKQYKTLLYNSASSCCPGYDTTERRHVERRLSNLYCVHQAVDWSTWEIFLVHDVLQRLRHSTCLSPVERGTPYEGVH